MVDYGYIGFSREEVERYIEDIEEWQPPIYPEELLKKFRAFIDWCDNGGHVTIVK